MKKLISGNIVEVYLKEVNQYIYMKHIDVREFKKEISFPFEFRIHKTFFKKPITTFGELDFSKLLISPLHLTGFKELIKIGEWKILAKQELTEYDQTLHQYKMAWPPNLAAIFDDVKQWRVLESLENVNKGLIVPYHRCAHLEYAENLGCNHLTLRLNIEYYKENDQLKKIDKSKLDKFEYALFTRYINMPLYSRVPDKFQGRLLPEDYSDSPEWLNYTPIINNLK